MKFRNIDEQNQAEKTYFKSMQKRLLYVFFIVIALLVILIAVIIKIALTSENDYNITILKQQNYTTNIIPYRRGTITDRNGTVLATSERVYILILDPSVILANNAKNEEATLNALHEKYGFDYYEMKECIEANPKRAYIRYKKNISEADKTAFENYVEEYNKSDTAKEKGKITGVWYENDYKRVYPFSTLACTVLGFSGTDSARGNWGLEEYYNSELIGNNGREYGYVNEDGVAERNVVAADDGNTLVSTIDYTIQDATEKKIAEFLESYDADNVAAIVMNPNNGEILAMATDKSYDLNDPSNLEYLYSPEEIAVMTDEQLSAARGRMWKNFCVQDAYEPGSTAKPFTVSAALEEKIVSESSEFYCEGEKHFGIEAYETIVHCNSTHGHIDLSESLMFSCNSAMMDIAAAMGPEIFSKYQTVFGFGRQTGIDLPGETAGILYDADTMQEVDLATNAFGQNYNVNMVQLAAAFASCINGGNYYQPHMVKQILNSSGEVVKTIDPILVRKTISTET
ncbi:MAG: penicillin-binding protein 2, partial [Lachnospiraceae bacterium]|nr:penicillin-binding protein 2 [Candidatus Minthocola equi]